MAPTPEELSLTEEVGDDVSNAGEMEDTDGAIHVIRRAAAAWNRLVSRRKRLIHHSCLDLTECEETAQWQTCETLEKHGDDIGRHGDAAHDPPEQSSVRPYRVEKAPEECKQRKLDQPQCCPRKGRQPKLEAQVVIIVMKPRGVRSLESIEDGFELVHWRRNKLVENAEDHVDEQCAQDEVVVDVKSPIVGVLQPGANGGETCCKEGAHPYDSLDTSSQTCSSSTSYLRLCSHRDGFERCNRCCHVHRGEVLEGHCRLWERESAAA